MPLYWLCYGHNNSIFVVIEPGASLIHAKMRAALDELDEGDFTEGHELDRKWKVAREMIGRRLTRRRRRGCWLSSNEGSARLPRVHWGKEASGFSFAFPYLPIPRIKRTCSRIIDTMVE